MIVSGFYWVGPKPTYVTEPNGETPTYVYWVGPNPAIRFIYEPAAPEPPAEQNNAIFFGMNF